MRITQSEIPNAEIVDENGKSFKYRLHSIDVFLLTEEISNLIDDLNELVKEGENRKGYHIHLADDSDRSEHKFEVSLYYDKLT